MLKRPNVAKVFVQGSVPDGVARDFHAARERAGHKTGEALALAIRMYLRRYRMPDSSLGVHEADPLRPQTPEGRVALLQECGLTPDAAMNIIKRYSGMSMADWQRILVVQRYRSARAEVHAWSGADLLLLDELGLEVREG